MSPQRRATLTVSLIAALTGALVSFPISNSAIGSGYEFLPLFGALAAFINAAFFWHILIGKSENYTFLRGAASGGLAGFFSHFFCWYIMILAYNICYWFWRGCTSSLGEPPLNPLLGIIGAAALSLFSLLYYWWLTVLPGFIIGGVLALWFQRIEKNRYPLLSKPEDERSP